MRARYKPDAQALEPTAICTATWTRRRCVYNVTLGARTLGTGISPTVAWEKALRKMLRERAVDHMDGNPYNHRIENLRVARIQENLRGQA